MAKSDNRTLIPDVLIMKKSYLFQGSKVMLDRDLADHYEIETKQLKRAVRRNISRFPDDFMFELSPEEFNNLRSQFGTSSWGGVRYAPLAFTEHGFIILASVLNSKRAKHQQMEQQDRKRVVFKRKEKIKRSLGRKRKDSPLKLKEVLCGRGSGTIFIVYLPDYQFHFFTHSKEISALYTHNTSYIPYYYCLFHRFVNIQ